MTAELGSPDEALGPHAEPSLRRRAVAAVILLSFAATGCQTSRSAVSPAPDALRDAAFALVDAAGYPDTLSVASDSIRVLAGRLFSLDHRHLLVRSGSVALAGEMTVGIYTYDGQRLGAEPLARDTLGPVEFVGDTLRDVNGDGFRDFVIREYPSSGCCRRDGHIVRLYDHRANGLAEPFLLINPTYFPDEGVVRGVEYGHPGEVALYTARFDGLGEPVPIECVYPVAASRGQFVRGACGQGPFPTGKRLSALPVEYTEINSLDWFLDY